MSKWNASDPVNQHLCKRIAQRRSELGLSQTKIANTLGISYQQYQKYEAGLGSISGAKLWHLARLFVVPVAWFYDGL